ncbi:hypothetical protein OG723_41150 (plasmid) [Streptomyces sp. NBC_01278]|uniref:hypothetical protein n=1 Tax=Streptomyces sp. NBC_01278 TaxID=2903809 RepID=UPI002E36BA54|nr:hypothetical protein [Streptomyces sp. NBC_01278]
MSDPKRLIEAFENEASRAWNSYQELGEEDISHADLEAIGKHAAEIAVGNIFWRLAIGDNIRATELADKVGRDTEEIVRQVADGCLVGLVGRNQTFLPLWQFEGGGDYGELRLGEAAQVTLTVFCEEMGSLFRPTYVISWASTKQPELGDREPRSLMSDEDSFPALKYSAKVAARRLAR